METITALTPDQLADALQHLEETDGLRLPHEHMPDILPDEDGLITMQAWRDYSWQGIEHGFNQSDPNASPKPEWADLLAAIDAVPLRNARGGILNLLWITANDAITKAYGASGWQDEMQKRLSGRTSTEQDAERDRLRARYQTVKAAIEEAASVERLEIIQAAIEDGSWAAEAEPSKSMLDSA